VWEEIDDVGSKRETVAPTPWGSVLLPGDSSKFERTVLDHSELWQSIVGDAAIHPGDRQAAYLAALRGDHGWYNTSASARIMTWAFSRSRRC
jgi:hypothetical protein